MLNKEDYTSLKIMKTIKKCPPPTLTRKSQICGVDIQTLWNSMTMNILFEHRNKYTVHIQTFMYIL